MVVRAVGTPLKTFFARKSGSIESCRDREAVKARPGNNARGQKGRSLITVRGASPLQG